MFKTFSAPLLSSGVGKADVTLCIPTYQAEPFIRRTLGFACGQTLKRVRILVSVDQSQDGTAQICHELAKQDPRITVIEQPVRRGWSGNVSDLIRRVDTEFFAMYYHDDILLPQFCEAMLAALRNAPEAATANCEVSWLGAVERKIPAFYYTGTVAERVATLFAYDQIPAAPMRNMVRTERFGHESLLDEKPGGINLHYGYLSRMMLSGDSVPVQQNLYIRWIREDGMMPGWSQHPWDDFHHAWTRVFELVAPVVEREVSDRREFSSILKAMTLRARDQLTAKAKTSTELETSLAFNFDLTGLETSKFDAELSPALRDALTGLEKRVEARRRT